MNKPFVNIDLADECDDESMDKVLEVIKHWKDYGGITFYNDTNIGDEEITLLIYDDRTKCSFWNLQVKNHWLRAIDEEDLGYEVFNWIGYGMKKITFV